MAATLATLAAVAAYGGGAVVILCAVPMLIIANCYRRLNLWNANCGASFEWVGRAISPYLGFIVGWLMLAGCLIGTISVVVVLSPAVLAHLRRQRQQHLAEHLPQHRRHHRHAHRGGGRHPHHRAHPGRLGGDRVHGPAGRLDLGPGVRARPPSGSYPITRGLAEPERNKRGAAAWRQGLLIAVFMFSGWDATVYVNEEVKHRRVNPGRAALWAVALLVIMYVLPQVGLQGVVSPAKLQANSSSALVYIAQVLGGGGWAKVMAFALALSVIASTNTGIVITARIAYGMASHRVLPPVLGQVSRRYSTPAIGSIIIGVILIADHLGIPAVHSGGDRLQPAGQRDRLAVRYLLPAHRARRRHLLPAPYLQQRLGRGARRHSPPGRRRVPGLGGGQVAAERAHVSRSGS